MSKSAEIRAQLRSLRQQMNQAQRDERRAATAEAREKARAELSPEQLEIENKLDQLALKVHGSPEGELWLEYLSDVRPVVADMIKERVNRANASNPTG